MSDTRQSICLLGATGSIGRSTLDVITRHPERFRVAVLTAASNVAEMARLCRRHHPQLAVMADVEAGAALAGEIADLPNTEVMVGAKAIAEAAALSEVDTIVAGIVGSVGLAPCLAAVRAGKRLLLANKEPLVVAGELLMAEARRCQATVLPIDSEHNGIFQLLPADYSRGLEGCGVERLILTASGGPFRTRDPSTFSAITVEEACRHPNWSMGRKISVDSATMMNKGLEVIEAARFFGIAGEQVDVVVHPQSLVHALVQYRDGSMLAEMGNPDMRTPIAHALAWPERITAGVQPLDLISAGQLQFEQPDAKRFPCLGLARQALAAGQAATAVLNAANEVAVAAFLQGTLRFDRIAGLIEETLGRVDSPSAPTLEGLMAQESEAKRQAQTLLAGEGR